MLAGSPQGFCRAKKNGRSSKTGSTRAGASATYWASVFVPEKRLA